MKKKALMAEVIKLRTEAQTRPVCSEKNDQEAVDREVRVEFLGLTLLSYQKVVRNNRRGQNNGH